MVSIECWLGGGVLLWIVRRELCPALDIQIYLEYLQYLEYLEYLLVRPVHDVASIIVLTNTPSRGAEHFHPSVKCELAFCSEEVDVVLEL